MTIKHKGGMPLCWQVRVQARGKHETTVKGPYTLTKARRIATMAEWQGNRATLEEIPDATARHRAIVHARKAS